jgi:hypothetical protein
LHGAVATMDRLKRPQRHDPAEGTPSPQYTIRYDSDRNEVTVVLTPQQRPVHYQVDFAGMPTSGIERLTIRGRIRWRNFDARHTDWQDRFVEDPIIDISHVVCGDCPVHSLWCVGTQQGAGFGEEWGMLPLGHLMPKEISLPLNSTAIIGFSMPNKKGRGSEGGNVAAWRLDNLDTTNLASLSNLQTITNSFNDMRYLNTPVLPGNITDITGSFNQRQGYAKIMQPWATNIFENCHELNTIEGSFSNAPLTGVDLKHSISHISNSFHYCNRLVSFGVSTEITVVNSVNHCPELATVDIPGGEDGDDNTEFNRSFIQLRTLTNINIPPQTRCIRSCFQHCKKLRTVNFLKDGNGNSALAYMERSFNHCAIEYVYGFDKTRVIELKNHCFGFNPLRFIALPASATSVQPEWADHLQDINQTGKESHLDVSRLSIVPSLMTDKPIVGNRGFDNIWLTNLLPITDNSHRTRSLWAFLYSFSHEGGKIHVNKGNMSNIEGAAVECEKQRVLDGKLPSHVGNLDWGTPTLDSTKRLEKLAMGASASNKGSYAAMGSIYLPRRPNNPLLRLPEELARMVISMALTPNPDTFKDPLAPPPPNNQ